jgi:uncharacterized protein YerC
MMVPASRSEIRKKRTLEVLCGGKVPSKLPKAVDLIAECLENPKQMYLYIEDIITDEKVQNLRMHLVRVQIDSELHMRDDVDHHTHRLWVAQTIERMVFGGLMVEGEKVLEDDEEED